MMSASSGNSMAGDLLLALEDRAKEIEALKRQLNNSERERKQLESLRHSFDAKQPPDLQMLLAQKRELQMQLEREESEKHELFSQINQLIGEIAQLRAIEGEAAVEKDNIVGTLRAQLEESQAEAEELKRDFGRKEREFQRISEELAELRAESERRERAFGHERSRLVDELSDVQRDLEMKAAALESLRLATTSANAATSGPSSAEFDALEREAERLALELREREDLLREATETNDALGQSLTEMGGELEAAQRELEATRQDHERIDVRQKVLEAEVVRLRESQSQAERTIKQKEREIVDVRKELAELRDAEGKERSTIEVDEAMLEGLRRKNAELSMQLTQKGESLERMEALVKALEESLRTIEAEGQKAHETNTRQKAEAESLRGELDALRSELERRRNTGDAYEAELDAIATALKTSRGNNAQSLASLVAHLQLQMVTNSNELEKEHRERDERNKIRARDTEELAKAVEDLKLELERERVKNAKIMEQFKDRDAEKPLGSEEEDKITELINENTRLAADLLDAQLHSEKEFNAAMAREREAWAAQMDERDRELEALRQKMASLSTSAASTSTSTQVDSVPTAKPRKASLNGTGGNERMNDATAHGAAEGDAEQEAIVAGLSAELDKQKRLVTVLRKKLQQQQLAERARTTVGAGNGT